MPVLATTTPQNSALKPKPKASAASSKQSSTTSSATSSKKSSAASSKKPSTTSSKKPSKKSRTKSSTKSSEKANLGVLLGKNKLKFKKQTVNVVRPTARPTAQPIAQPTATLKSILKPICVKKAPKLHAPPPLFRGAKPLSLAATRRKQVRFKPGTKTHCGLRFATNLLDELIHAHVSKSSIRSVGDLEHALNGVSSKALTTAQLKSLYASVKNITKQLVALHRQRAAKPNDDQALADEGVAVLPRGGGRGDWLYADHARPMVNLTRLLQEYVAAKTATQNTLSRTTTKAAVITV